MFRGIKSYILLLIQDTGISIVHGTATRTFLFSTQVQLGCRLSDKRECFVRCLTSLKKAFSPYSKRDQDVFYVITQSAQTGRAKEGKTFEVHHNLDYIRASI